MNIQEVQELISANIVLVAEDEPMLRESLQQMLGYFFAQVDAAADGQEALISRLKIATILSLPT